MGEYKAYVTKANEYEKMAKDVHKDGKSEQSRQFYLEAAKSYALAMKNCPVDQERTFYKENAERCISFAEALLPKKKKVPVGAGSSRQNNYRSNDSARDEDENGLMELSPVERPTEKFADVAGLYDVKKQIKDSLIDPRIHKELYKKYNVKPARGILLYGPPGCGKTYIMRAAAGESGASLFTLNLSKMLSKWVGETEQNIRHIFEVASANTPCIAFFDEIDGIGGVRSDKTAHAKNFTGELLVQLDGAEKLAEGVFIVGATNLPWDVDEAILRAGRLDTLILVPPPDLEARTQLLQLYTRGMPVEGVDYQALAKVMRGYTGADIKAVCQDAAKIPLDEAKKTGIARNITLDDFVAARKNRPCPSPSLRIWLDRVKRSQKARNFPDLMALVKEYDNNGNNSDDSSNNPGESLDEN